MPTTGDWPEFQPAPVVHPSLLPRRRVLLGLAGLAGAPVLLTLAACTAHGPEPEPSGSSSRSTGGPTSATTPPTIPPPVDAPALEAAAADAIALLATYEATVAAHAELGPVLAPYELDHDTHLDALAEHITLPTASPSASTAPPVPADAAAARAAVVQAEKLTGEAARDAARVAQDGEAARLLASIGASRAVHALLLGAPG